MKEWMKRRGLWIAMLVIMLAIVCTGTAGAELTEDQWVGRILESEWNEATHTQTPLAVSLRFESNCEIPDYSSFNETPWAEYKDSIEQIVIGDGVTKIGKNAFAGLGKTVRVDFTGTPSTMLQIHQEAFTGSTVICRYYDSDWEHPQNLSGVIEWKKLPVFYDSLLNNLPAFYYDQENGWCFKKYNPSTMQTEIYLPKSLDELDEITYFAKYSSLSVNLEDLPMNEEMVRICCNWEKVHSVFFVGATGNAVMTLPAKGKWGSTYIACNSDISLNLTITGDSDDHDHWPTLYISDGTIQCNGNLSLLELVGPHNGDDETPANVTINGTIHTLRIAMDEAVSPFSGSLTINGTVQKGSVSGQGVISIQGVNGNIPITGLAKATLDNATFNNVTLIDQGEPVSDYLDIPDDVMALYDEYNYEVGKSWQDPSRNDWRLSLQSSQLGTYTQSVCLTDYKQSFSEEDIDWDKKVNISVNDYVGNLVLNGSPEQSGYYEMGISNSNVVINSPVKILSIMGGECNVTINVPIEYQYEMSSSVMGSIILGPNGDVAGAMRDRLRGWIGFTAKGPMNPMYSNGYLYALSHVDGEKIDSLLPRPETVTEQAKGLEGDEKAYLDLHESSEEKLSNAERTALNNTLSLMQAAQDGQEEGAGSGEIFAVVDTVMLAYQEDEYGNVDLTSKRLLNEANDPLTIKVSDLKEHQNVRVIRLHEEVNGLVAEELQATVSGDVITFASDKFSKFVLLSGEATGDKQFDKPEIGLQETYQSNEPIQITLPQVADAATYAIEILNGETVQYSAAWNAGEVGNQGCVFELNTMEGETIQRPMEPGNYIARITLTGEGYTDGIFDYPFEVEEDNPSAKSIEWTLTNGILNIQYTGSGPSVITEHPWTEQAEEIIQVIIGEGITEIGADAFAGCSNMTSITIPGSVTKIAEAFTGCSALAEVYFGGIEEDLTGMTVRSYKPGYEPISKARKTCRESAVVNMENYSFAFTCQKTDGTTPQFVAGEEDIVYTVENYEEIRLILAGNEIEGYTKSYRLEAYYEFSRLAAEGTGTASTSILPSFGMANTPIWYRAYAVYEPQDKDSPVLISEKKTLSFQTKKIRDLEEDIVNIPMVYVLGTEGGYTVQLTLPENIEPEALQEWRIMLKKGYTTLYDAKSNRNSDSWIQGSRTQTMTIPDSEMECGKRYILEVSAKVLGYREYFYNDSFIVLNVGEDPSKLLDSPEISFSKPFYYQGEAAVLTIKKVEHAENYTIRIRNEEEAECYTTVKTAKDFAGGESLQVRIQTDDFTKEQYYRAEVVCSADGYISNISKISSETGFNLYDIGIPSLSVSAPEQYIKKRNPAETDGLLITVGLGWNMQGCEADNWLLTVKKGTVTVFTRERQEDSYNGVFLVPDNCLTAGEEYTYSLTLWFGGFETYKSEEKSFRVLAPAEDSLTYEVSDVDTPEGRKKVLNITANGEIPDYTTENPAPWAASGSEVYQINLKGDLSRIGSNAFAGFNKDGLRITFYQGGKPVISETAFAGCNHIVCRYYTENSSWAGGGNYGAETVEWIYLPVDRGTGYDGDAAWFDYTSSGWALLIYNSETSSYVRHPMTLRQAQETAYGENILIDFYAFPKASDSVLYAGWKNVYGVSFLDGFSGSMEMNLGSDHVISRVTVDSPDANIVIHNPKKLELLRCGSGTLNYTGNIREVTLSESESNSDSVTVTGTIDTLSFYTAPQYKAYRGSMTLNGTITAGTVAGGVSIEIPGIGNVPIDNLASYTFGTITKENEKVIEKGVWLGEKTEARISLDMYKLWYGINDTDSGRWIMLTLTPKAEYQDVLGTESIPYNTGDITTDQIVCGEDTSITIQTFPRNGTVVLNGESEDGQRKGYGSVSVMYGDVKINCPVDTITVENRSRYTTGINLVINDKVNLLELQSIYSGTIVLDQNGEVNNGIWRRANQAIRYFGPVTDGGTLYQKGGLYAMSWREGETLKSLLPGEDEISAAAGLNDGRIASADVSESSVSDLHVNESTALDNYLSTNGGETKTVFDATVMAYSMDADGNAGEGEPVTSLNSPIGFRISNETGEAVCVVRLHEENGTVNAEKVSEVTDDTVISFESSLFSKYAIVTAGEALPEPTDIFIIPSSVTVIEEDAFYGTAGDKYVIPDGVTAIPSGAFAYLQKTAVIVIPDSVKTISDQAFAGSDIIFQCSSDSTAAQWAASHEITTKAPED